MGNYDVSGDRIVWIDTQSGVGSDLYTWTPSGGMAQLTFDAAGKSQARVSGDRVVWQGSDDTSEQIFTWTPDGGVVRLTSGSGWRGNPTVSGDRVVWYGKGISSDSEITMWTPTGGSQQVTTDGHASYPIISGNRMVWIGMPSTTAEIYTAVADDKPAITGISPAVGLPSGGNSVVITGDNLSKVSGANGVTFGDADAAYTIDSDSQIIATAPAHSAGSVNVGVRSGTGPVGYGPNAYVYAGVPTINNLSRHAGDVDGGSTVIISGTGFYELSGGSAVTFGGANAASYVVNSNTQITAVSPPHAEETVNVAVTAIGGSSVDAGAADDFAYSVIPNAVSRVSVSAGGAQGTKASRSSAISANGRYVAFSSSSSNLVPGGFNGNLLVRDLQTGNVEMASVDSSGNPANSLTNYEESFSADGRYVVFTSAATNLVPNDTNDCYDVFVHDRQTGTTARASVSTAGVEGNGYSQMPSISADGRYVVFYSDSSNLVSGDTNGANDVFLHDMQTGTTSRISVSSSGTAGNSESFFPSISADGRYVVFTSAATNLVSGDTNGIEDVFVRDLQAGTTTRVSVSSSGAQCSGKPSEDVEASISADGRYVAFEMAATGLVSGDTNATNDVFLRDRTAGTTVRVSVASDGSQGNGMSRDPCVSNDGRYVAFDSSATNLVSGDTNAASDVFVHDCLTDTTTVVSEGDGVQGDGPSGLSTFSMSSDGRKVAFYSLAGNLVAGDTNGVQDVFVALCPSMTRFEETDPRLVYAGSWASFPNTSASGGAYQRANTAGSSVTIYFDGTRLDWIAMKGTTTGKAEVSLDDGPATAVDLNAGSAAYRVSVWSTGTIEAGIHKVVISWKADTVSGRYVTLDALDVVGDLADAPPTIGSVSPDAASTAGGDPAVITGSGFVGLSGPAAVTFDGVDAASYTVNSSTLITAISPAHAAGTVRVQVTTASGFTFDTGTDDFTYAVPGPPTIISVSPATGSTLGGTSVTINGSGFTDVSSVTFDGASVPYTLVSSSKITTTAPAHAAGSVPVEVTTATGSVSSSFTYSVAAPTTRMDIPTTTTAGLTVSGTWAAYKSASAYGGSYLRSSTAGAYAVITFKGTRLDWITMKGTTGAKADIYVDGSHSAAATALDLYASPAAYQQNVFTTGTLADGYHTVKIVRDAASASGRYLTLDAVEIAGTLAAPVRYEETASLFTWNPPSWTLGSTASASGGSYRYTNSAGAYVSFSFTGVGFKLIAKTTTSYGNLTVTIDGVSQTVSLYSSVATYKKVVLTAFLAPGTHTVKLSRAGTKSFSSTGLTIDLDAVDVWGQVP